MTQQFIKKVNDNIAKIEENSNQITLTDSRFYKIHDKYYPSITYVLQYYPKGPYFEDWLKKVGYASDYIVKKASDEGTKVHSLIEEYLSGEEMNFFHKNYNPKYSTEIWQMFLRFVEFWENYNPTILNKEFIIHSEEFGVAGTCDLICEINGQLWLIDFKTSNQLHTSYEIQTAIYGKCFEEIHGKRPDRFGVLWLKSNKRKLNKEKFQGKGWELFESSRSFEENIEIFKAIKTIFDIENPIKEPNFTSFKTTVSLSKNF